MKIRNEEIEKLLSNLSHEINLLEDAVVEEVEQNENSLDFKLENWNSGDLESLIRRNYVWKSGDLLEALRDLERYGIDYTQDELIENVLNKLYEGM